MEVRLTPPMAGCLYWPLVLCSFGMVALAVNLGERHFIRHMDAAGVTTRGGKRIAWNEFTAVERLRRKMNGSIVSDEFLMKSTKGKVSLPTWRAINAKEAQDFLLQHLPPHLFQSGQR